MLVVLTNDLYLIEWTLETPPATGDVITTDLGPKTVMKVMGNDNNKRGVPRWAVILRANLNPVEAESA